MTHSGGLLNALFDWLINAAFADNKEKSLRRLSRNVKWKWHLASKCLQARITGESTKPCRVIWKMKSSFWAEAGRSLNRFSMCFGNKHKFKWKILQWGLIKGSWCLPFCLYSQRKLANVMHQLYYSFCLPSTAKGTWIYELVHLKWFLAITQWRSLVKTLALEKPWNTLEVSKKGYFGRSETAGVTSTKLSFWWPRSKCFKWLLR